MGGLVVLHHTTEMMDGKKCEYFIQKRLFMMNNIVLKVCLQMAITICGIK